MRAVQGRKAHPDSRRREGSCVTARRKLCRRCRSDEGFTLIELIVVVTVLPLIVGGLALGLLSVFSLQSSVSNRLGDTGDSQVVAASFESDVQSSVYLTTQSLSSPQCGTSNQTQLMGLEWNPFSTGGGYQVIVSYSEVQVGTAWNLVRNYCSVSSKSSGYITPTSTSTISYNLEVPCSVTGGTVGCQSPPNVVPGTGQTLSPDPGSGFTSTQSVTRVEFPLAEPHSTEVGGSYQYTLAAVPADSAEVAAAGGAPIAPASNSGCNFASPGTGTYASTLCLVDFSSLTGNNLLAAEQGCLEMSVSLPGGSTLYFCIGITGQTIYPKALPTWSNAFLGNACTGSTGGGCTDGTPFYTGIAGEPALYQTGAGTTTVNITKISVLNPQGLPATGWEAVGVDAESTDNNEWISFTANEPVTILPNGESIDTPTDPVGNACNSGADLTYSNPVPLSSPTTYYTVTCDGVTTSTVKTGTPMVYAVTPTTFSSSFYGDSLEAMAFGLLLS
jgi:prepilin-type N-terminal cleavage/methylation domain-containing protein